MEWRIKNKAGGVRSMALIRDRIALSGQNAP